MQPFVVLCCPSRLGHSGVVPCRVDLQAEIAAELVQQLRQGFQEQYLTRELVADVLRCGSQEEAVRALLDRPKPGGKRCHSLPRAGHQQPASSARPAFPFWAA